jgi:ABC-type transport system involved in multi-copper enzyme maturation permease subunit
VIGIIGTIAYNTFRETIRNKVLYTILFFAGIIIVMSVSFGEWSVFARIQVMEDFGLATMSISGLLLSVFIGVGMLGRELTTKTVYLLASKPLPRSTIVIGKFLGLCLTLCLNLCFMSFFLLISLEIMGGKLDLRILSSVILTIAEMAVIVAAALFFSTITTTTLAALFTVAFYLIGHFNDMIGVDLFAKVNPAALPLLKTIYYLFPNLEHFNIRVAVIYNLAIPTWYVVYAIAYALAYCSLLLIFSCIIFSRKDL